MVRGHQRKAPMVKSERRRRMAKTKVEAAADVWSCKARRGGVSGDLEKIPVIARCWNAERFQEVQEKCLYL